MTSNFLSFRINQKLLEDYLAWYRLFKNPTEDGFEALKYLAKKVLSSPLLSERDFTLDTCLHYMSDLKTKVENGEYSPNTFYYYTKILRSVSEYLSKTSDFVDIRDQFPKIKQVEVPIVPLTPEEIDKIINIPTDKMGPQRDWVMYNAFISLLAYSGRRIKDIRMLTVKEVDFESGFMLLKKPKGGRPEWVPLPSGAIPHLEKYLESRSLHTEGLLFPSPRGNTPLTRRTIGNELLRRAKEVGITKPVNPHNFRHSFPRPLLKNKVPLNVVKDLLGHKNILSTMRYTHMLPEDLKEASVMHPGNKSGIPGDRVAQILLEVVELYRDSRKTFRFSTKTKNKSLQINFRWEE